MTALLDVADLDDLAYGAAFLGTGGGGDPYIGKLLAQEALRRFGPVRLMALDDVPADAHVISCGAMGAPTIVIEKLPAGDEMASAFAHYEACTGQRVGAIIPLEIGGLNSCLPIVLAARAGLPLIDADGMGRAFPELQMCTFHVHAIPACPLAMADEHGNRVLVETRTAPEAEALAREICIRMGGQGHVLSFPMSGAECRRAAVPATMSLARDIGRTVRQARTAGSDPVAALLRFLCGTHYEHAALLGAGKITDVSRRFRGGWTIGVVTVQPFDGSDPFVIQIQNENLVVERAGQVLAVVPDLICLLDFDTAQPIPTERLRYGQRARIIGLRAPAIMRTGRALEVFGPAAFGLDLAYRPLGA